MILPKPEDALHKAWLYRLLSELADNALLMKNLRFKGGTCAAMQGLINRFSVDLDFDLVDENNLLAVRTNLEKIFKELGLSIKDKSSLAPQYFLKYPAEHTGRSSLKIDATFPTPKSNSYESVHFPDINKTIICQDKPTMFANKLFAVLDRYEKTKSVAGRDFFDIQSFYLLGLKYNVAVIEERYGGKCNSFFRELKKFVEQHVSQRQIDEDLNSLLPLQDFQKARKHILNEVMMFLNQEL